MTKHRPTRSRSPFPAGSGTSPVVAIVGRPNVGKSTLFNRLARARLAIVHDEPGVTRDRHYADTAAFGRPYTLVDTGGFDPESDDAMRSGIATQVRAAIREADVVVFLTDASSELAAADRAAIGLLRRSDKPVIYAANKADTPGKDADAFDLYRFGVDHVFPVSALHGRGIGDLEAAIVQALPPHRTPRREDDEENLSRPPRVAIIGRPNAGKSSLLNRVLGEERMLVSDQPGTTRDSIETLVQRGDDAFVLIDTAGIRRKGKVAKADDAVETISVLQAIRSIERAHVSVLVCDAAEGVAEQDAKILGLADERGRAMVIALNKCDLLSKDDLSQLEERTRDKISFAPYVPIVRLSAKTGRGVPELLRTVSAVAGAYRKRITTGELNRFFEKVLEVRPPPTMGGRAPRLYFITQAEIAPPTFVVITNAPEHIHFSYRRFVVNQLRSQFGFEGCPIRVHYKEKRRRGTPPTGARAGRAVLGGEQSGSEMHAMEADASTNGTMQSPAVVRTAHGTRRMVRKPKKAPPRPVTKSESAPRESQPRRPKSGSTESPSTRPASSKSASTKAAPTRAKTRKAKATKPSTKANKGRSRR